MEGEKNGERRKEKEGNENACERRVKELLRALINGHKIAVTVSTEYNWRLSGKIHSFIRLSKSVCLMAKN